MLDMTLTCQVEGSASSAAPTTASARHPNSGLISPLQQGHGCEGLSGLYAAVNGIRLAVAQEHWLTDREVHGLMRTGLQLLGARLTAQQCILNGIRLQLWQRFVVAMVDVTRQRLGVIIRAERLHLETLQSRNFAFCTLEQAVANWCVPLMLCRGGHYTVVSGVTGASLILFDSGGASWISKQASGVPGDGLGARHTIYPASFMALRA